MCPPGPFAIVTVSGDTLLAPAGDVRIEMATLSGDIRSKVGGRTEGGYHRPSLGENARAWLRGAEGRPFEPLPAAGFTDRGTVA